MQAVLATEEHHGVHGAGEYEEPALPVPGLHSDDVQADRGERRSDQPVVRIGQMEPEVPATDDERGHHQGHEGDRGLKARRPRHARANWGRHDVMLA